MVEWVAVITFESLVIVQNYLGETVLSVIWIVFSVRRCVIRKSKKVTIGNKGEPKPEAPRKMENAKNNSSAGTVRSEKPTSSSANPESRSKFVTGGNKLKRAFSLSRNPFQSVHSRKAVEKSGTVTSAAAVATMTNANANVVTSEQNSINSGGGSTGGKGGSGTETKVQVTSDSRNGSEKKIFRRLSVKKFINRIAQQMTYVNLAGNQKADIIPTTPQENGFVWPPDTVPGVIGLRNHGNTCFMNAVLQCLSHTDILAEYFVLDQYKADLKRRNKINAKKFGTKGELTEQLALVLKALWTCKDAPEHSSSFKAAVDRYGSQFRSSTQHDAQEFLFWLLDKVHEDLNTASKRKYKAIKNNYGRSDEAIAAETLANHIRCNNSFVQAVFQAQFRSSLTCPRCHKQSNTFDPFHCISVQLPQLTQQPVFVRVIYALQQPKQVLLGLGVPHGSSVVVLREQLHADTGIAVDRMILTEMCDSGFTRVYCDSHLASSMGDEGSVYCVESPLVGEGMTQIVLCISNARRDAVSGEVRRFGTPFCIVVNRDVSYVELQKMLLKEMSGILKSEVFTYSTPLLEMFKMRLQDPSCDADAFLEATVEHPLFTEMIDLALSVLPTDAGPAHVKLLIEWVNPERFFSDMTDPFVEHESVSQMKEKMPASSALTLEQCLEHYTKAETLSAEDAWRCPHCQKYLPVVKTLGLWSLPDIMVIHFKRFRQQQLRGPQSAKLTTLVKFPLNGFDMSPHLARDPNVEASAPSFEDNWSPWRRTSKRHTTHSSHQQSFPLQVMDNQYDLYAVCYHQGDTLETGHYTAACKNPYDHHWYKFDDQRVTQVPNDRVQEEIVNNEAYILFYQRRRIDGSECSGTSSSSGADHWVSRIAAAPLVVPSVETKPREDPPKSTTPVPSTAASDPTPVPKKADIEEVQIIHSESESDESDERTTNCPDEEATEIVSEKNQKTEIKTQTVVQVDVEVQAIVEPSEETKPTETLPSEKEAAVKPLDKDIIKDEEFSGDPTTSEAASEEPSTPELRKSLIIDPPSIDEKHYSSSSVKSSDTSSRFSLPTTHSHFQDILWRENTTVSDFINSHHHHHNHHHHHSHHRPSSYTYKSYESDAVSMIRGANTCSKDTLLFIDQQSHAAGLDRIALDDDDDDVDDLMSSTRALWISPVTPHKLITVSPKN
ncbi:ubiquitin carboxyl-terminal hydrolase 31 isoform X2 [Malaya genurostris]|uniref:ubiquitin carboxyl-terminal hydrolase 31 isoform X2 n=1 Tax=Malaya genurostris TaxID=325434 RepID=UPI0026F3B3F0|nr:ubiquitin carboxyl-terminal hydrolase 31 isoform X2 [Malaya genurostris]